MAIIKWHPFQTDWFDEEFRKIGGYLAVDMYEDNGNLIVEMQIPGVRADKIDISIEDDILRISGTKEEKEELKDKDYYHKEIRTGSFERAVHLPLSVVADKAAAKCDDGILKVSIPKRNISETGKVKVKVGK